MLSLGSQNFLLIPQEAVAHALPGQLVQVDLTMAAAPNAPQQPAPLPIAVGPQDAETASTVSTATYGNAFYR